MENENFLKYFLFAEDLQLKEKNEEVNLKKEKEVDEKSKINEKVRFYFIILVMIKHNIKTIILSYQSQA